MHKLILACHRWYSFRREDKFYCIPLGTKGLVALGSAAQATNEIQFFLLDLIWDPSN